jgi:hypothetical protein
VSNTRTTSRPLRSVPQPAQDGAMMLAAALGLALDQAPLQPGCARCVDREKRAGAAQPRIRVAVTWQDGQPVCYEDYEVRLPYDDFEVKLPPQRSDADRPVHYETGEDGPAPCGAQHGSGTFTCANVAAVTCPACRAAMTGDGQ